VFKLTFLESVLEMQRSDGSTISPATGASALIEMIEDPSLGAERLRFAAGEEIHADDAPATHLFLIDQGQIRLYQRGPTDLTRLVDVMGPQEWFGVAALAGAATYGVRAMAVNSSTVWKIDIERLLATLSERPEVLAALSRELARGLVEAREEASRLIFEDCNQRLISALIRLSTSAASTPHDDGVVLRMTHSQLAQAVGAARETVSLGLTQLRNRNLLRTGRNELFFKPEDLRRTRVQ
jgi:CRP/FNR family cyclic AMP-dependent transcriptional regulator